MLKCSRLAFMTVAVINKNDNYKFAACKRRMQDESVLEKSNMVKHQNFPRTFVQTTDNID